MRSDEISLHKEITHLVRFEIVLGKHVVNSSDREKVLNWGVLSKPRDFKESAKVWSLVVSAVSKNKSSDLPLRSALTFAPCSCFLNSSSSLRRSSVNACPSSC